MNLVNEACPVGHENVVGAGTIAGGCSAVGDRRAGVADEGFDGLKMRNWRRRQIRGRSIEPVWKVLDLLDVEDRVALEIGNCAFVVILALLGGEGAVLDDEGTFLALSDLAAEILSLAVVIQVFSS